MPATRWLYHLAAEDVRAKLLEVFRLAGRAVEASGDADFRALIRKSPLPPADVLSLKAWTTGNLEALTAASADGTLLNAVFAEAHRYLTSKSVATVSDQAVILPTLKDWIDGKPFHQLAQALVAADVRIGRDRVTPGHLVALCEGGFGFDLAMVVASMADLIEPMTVELSAELAELQRQIKYGLKSSAALAFYEAGFADRVVAQALGAAFAGVTNRAGVRTICRQDSASVGAVLDEFPSYFAAIAAELKRT